MKIINRKEFMKLPDGIIYCNYQACAFGDLMMKGDSMTWGDDFLCCSLIGQPVSNSSDEYMDILDNAEETGDSFKLETDCFGRDGMFDTDQLFAIYEKEDIEQLINTLKSSLK